MIRLLFLGLCFVNVSYALPARQAAEGATESVSTSAREGFRPIPFGDSPEHAYGTPFFPNAEFDPAITPPEAVLGRPVGSRLARHGEVLQAFRTWSEESDRLDLAPYGRTFEDRGLVRAVISSPENIGALEEIGAAHRRLVDPRGLSVEEGDRILAEVPAIAWLGYSIHGDETSGTDASLAVAYRLLAGTDAEVTDLLRKVVVVMDPCMNPDGRMRTVNQVEQNAGYVANLDIASRHRGHWPYGRGNHYLFDMNRDWIAGVCPETRGRWRVATEFPPQLFVDAHEMGGFDTYLFYPQSRPLNPWLPPRLPAWQSTFAAQQAQAFDVFGWGYYTREWADAWAPIYSDAWGSLNGAIGLLYEQASVSGQALRRPSGRVVSYRQAVHGHVVSSLSNLATFSANRRAILDDYLAFHRAAVDPETEGAERAYVVVPGRAPGRETALVDLLQAQGIEVLEAAETFEAKRVAGTLEASVADRSFPAGSWVVPARQPRRAHVLSYLGFDPRMDPESLQRERESLEREGESTIYDVSAWDLGRAFDLDAYWCEPAADIADRDRFPLAAPVEPVLGGVSGSNAAEPFAFVVDGSLDASLRFAVEAMERGLRLHVADKPFRTEGQDFPRGSLILRRHENGAEFRSRVQDAARAAGVVTLATGSGRSPDDGPDLGGGHFHLLERPRVAVLGGAPVESDSYGHVWYWLDVELGVPFSILDAYDLGAYDLRRYNVLVVPPGWSGRLEAVLGENAEALERWVRTGGLLVACGSGAAAVTSVDGLTDVALRRDVLDELDRYSLATRLELGARDIEVDVDRLWGQSEAERTEPGEQGRAERAGDGARSREREQRDAWARRFAPTGVLLRANVDPEHWLAFGAREEMPVGFAGPYAFLARDPVRTPVRLAGISRIRLGGLLWPEASERIAESCWLTYERKDNGGVILFASPPVFRGISRGTARLFANAVVLGPGLGADAAGEW